MWHLYVVRCVDTTLYTGVTTEVSRRVEEHNRSPRGARYTRERRPVTLAASWGPFDGRSEAQRLEARFKRLGRRAKLALLTASTEELVGALLPP